MRGDKAYGHLAQEMFSAESTAHPGAWRWLPCRLRLTVEVLPWLVPHVTARKGGGAAGVGRPLGVCGDGVLGARKVGGALGAGRFPQLKERRVGEQRLQQPLPRL